MVPEPPTSAAAADELCTELLEQVADLSDQLVFLQRLIPKTLTLASAAQTASLVQEAALLINTPCGALSLDGAWIGVVPGWLRSVPPPLGPMVTPLGQIYTGPPFQGAWRPTALLAVPFAHGWIAFWGKRQFQASERRLVEALANLLNSALEAEVARSEIAAHTATQRDRDRAQGVWRSVVPVQLHSRGGYRLELHSQPASDFGGDFQFQEADWLVVGDVSGKGLPAAIVTAMFAAAMPVAARQQDLIGALSDAMHRHLEHANLFCTLAAVQLGPDGACRIFNLGHPPILLRRADGTLEEFRAAGPPIGTFELSGVNAACVWLHPGDQLLLYSDGLYESELPEGTPFGLDRLRSLTRTHAGPSEVIRAALAALQPYLVADDLTIIAVERDPKCTGASRRFTGTLEVLPIIGEVLREAVSEDHPALMSAELALTELVVNAVRHGGAGDFGLMVHPSGDDLLVTLIDDGAAFDPTTQALQSPGELREHGYGLLIIQRSSRGWFHARDGRRNRNSLRFRRPQLTATHEGEQTMDISSPLQQGNTLYLNVSGRLDAQSAVAFRAAMHEAAGQRPSVLRLGLSGVTVMDSSALAAIVSALKLMRSQGGSLVLSEPSLVVRELLSLTMLDQIIRTEQPTL